MLELCCEYLSVQCIWLYVLVVSRRCFKVNPHSIVAWMSRSKELLAQSQCEIWNLSDCSWSRTHNRLVPKQTFNHLAKLQISDFRWNSDFAPVSSKKFLDIQVTIESGFTLKHIVTWQEHTVLKFSVQNAK